MKKFILQVDEQFFLAQKKIKNPGLQETLSSVIRTYLDGRLTEHEIKERIEFAEMSFAHISVNYDDVDKRGSDERNFKFVLAAIERQVKEHFQPPPKKKK